MYETFEKLLNERGVTASDVSKATGIARSNFTDWKKGRTTPKVDKLQLIADYFGVPLETFTSKRKKRITAVFTPDRNVKVVDMFGKPDLSVAVAPFDRERVVKEVLATLENNLPAETGHPVYYEDEETARLAQRVFEDPKKRMLFDAAVDARPADIELATKILERLKETNPDG